MMTSELLATLDHPIAVAVSALLQTEADTLFDISRQIESADDSDAPTWAATIAKCDAETRKSWDDAAAFLKAMRADIYLTINGHAEKDSDRSLLIESAKVAYYNARRAAILIETSCEVPGFVNLYLGTLDLPEGAGLRKSMKNVK